MRSVSLEEVAKAARGSLSTDGNIRVKSVGTDTRNIKGKDLFIALKGPRFDGHSFLTEAASGGVKAAVVSVRNKNLREFAKDHPDFPLVKVRDTLKALGEIAAYVRDGLDIKVAGITGTTGKTCTRDYLVSALSTTYKVAHSPGNYNNEIGLPLTVLQARRSDKALVVEMGARRPGDIKRLAEIASPDFGIITNVGPGHLELFKNEELVARTKAELAKAIPEGGCVVLNADDDHTRFIAKNAKARVVRFGLGRGADYRAVKVECDHLARPTFILKGPGFSFETSLPGVGRHQVYNALAASACAHEMGVDPAGIEAGLRATELSEMRMEVKRAPGGYMVVNDTYNANPHSMARALEALADMGSGKRTVAVLGGMAELGRNSRKFHEEVGALVASFDIDILVTVGKQARTYASTALIEGIPKGSVFRCAGIEDAAELLAVIAEPGDAIMLKASRVAGLEDLAARLLDNGFIDEKMVANV